MTSTATDTTSPVASGSAFTATARAEWTKLRTVRSTMWSLLVTVGIIVGLGALLSAARVSRWDRLDPSELRRFDPTGFSLSGLLLAQLAIGVLGVLVISSEYATGQIRATLGATPQRGLVLTAKVLVFAVVTFVVGLAACFAAFFLGQSIFSAKHAQASLGDPDVLRAVIGGALYLTVLGALGIGLGTIVRRTSGAIAVLVTMLLILPVLAELLPSPWNDDVSKYLPAQAGGGIFRVIPRTANALSPWNGFAVFVGYAHVSLLIGAVLLTRRDA